MKSFEEKNEILKRETGAYPRHLERRVDTRGPWGEAFGNALEQVGMGMVTGIVGSSFTGKSQMAIELIRSMFLGDYLPLMRIESAGEFEMKMSQFYRKALAANQIEDPTTFVPKELDEYDKFDLLFIDEIRPFCFVQHPESEVEEKWVRWVFNRMLMRRFQKTDTFLIATPDSATLYSQTLPPISNSLNRRGGIIECNWPKYSGEDYGLPRTAAENN